MHVSLNSIVKCHACQQVGHRTLKKKKFGVYKLNPDDDKNQKKVSKMKKKHESLPQVHTWNQAWAIVQLFFLATEERFIPHNRGKARRVERMSNPLPKYGK